jgi:glyoxylase-like metal-dependent hydrolase (beta-lactamase superfamily II)
MGMAIAGGLCLAGLEGSAQQSRPDNEITKLADDVYLFRHQFHQAIFITTPEGVILTDPISSDAATWLKAELKTFTDQPVRYVVYSHHHSDHITGGSVFDDHAVFISHAAARTPIVEAADRMTPVPQAPR